MDIGLITIQSVLLILVSFVLSGSIFDVFNYFITGTVYEYKKFKSYSYLQRCFLILLIPVALLSAFIVIGLILATLTMALETESFWYSFPCLAGFWLYCRKESGIKKNIADWLKPLLIGMAVIGIITVTASKWIPKAQWVWLFRIESAAENVYWILDKILPKALWEKLFILILAMVINILFPVFIKWTKRFDNALNMAKTVSGVLAITVSMTIFGEGQSGEIGKLIDNEKAKRVEADTTAIAQLIVSARLKENTQEEVKATVQWLEAVYVGVNVDLNTPPTRTDLLSVESTEERLQELIKSRIAELHKAIQEQPVFKETSVYINSQLTDKLGRQFTEQDRASAKVTFEKSLEYFVSSAAEISSHPINDFLKSISTPELVQDLVKDLYKEEVKNFSKIVTNPFTDSLFRPQTLEAKISLAKASEMIRQPTFSPQTLPSEIVHPTVESRMNKIRVENALKEAVAKAGRR